MKKTVSTLVASAMLVSGLTACGSSDTGGAADKGGAAAGKDEAKPFTVSLRHVQVRDDAKLRLKLLEDVAKRMEENVPGLKVELEGVEDKVNRFEKLPAEMAAGTPPTIFDLFGGTDTQKFVKAGRLLDLTPILAELGLKDKFLNLDEFTVDGKIYGLPTAGFVEGVFYNKKIFKDLGAEVPKTWEEFVAVAEKSKAKNITPLAFASSDAWVINMLMNTLWVRTAGAESVNGFVAGTKKWTDGDVLDGFKKFETLVKSGYFQEGNLGLKYAEQQNKFRAGEAAMLFDGSWANSAVVDPEKSKIANDVGFFNFPATGGKGDGLINGSFSNGYGFSATLNDNEMKAVKEFIKIMYSEEMQKRQLKESGFLPALKISDLSGVNPIVGEILKVANAKQFPAFDSVIQAKVREALEVSMQEMIGGKATAEQVVEKVQKAQDAANKESK
ncbi:family 1 extracellular solute-binding protein [Paenibacillus mucilaginosus 3016]|uniref:Family 1 extracellular solute-binding protein n=2 Tax=Paenibacillus mucilaginosus TaxID=61624 RepID=H6NBH3_9BACL|nr:extracellular solute-binding protein [Paenibacillus mucilaginosus]AFC32919.1 family 1 extracellular solute-binding protein [Paenibacillus mucilaginosus 3016]AFH65229.1 ABC transporter substrate-binding protein [Paenibacillus mucilaginosus K02]WFA21367.1 extracellular solute-binding protein [Paenibacillus mucilaginosus]